MRDIPGYEGKYAVTEDGSVWSYPNLARKTGAFLKLNISTTGYYYVSLSIKSMIKKFKVHRLVALTYIPNPDNKITVNHKDGNKLNNCINNLEWATQAENNQHARNTKLNIGYIYRGGRDKKILCIETNTVYKSIKEASAITKTHTGNISSVCAGRRTKAGGFTWRFL